ncbi:MAG: hypothetical protein LBQ10_06295 [Desulfovibrio sp.]|nr:hypothetical protein [Desulfovibrio sp.]
MQVEFSRHRPEIAYSVLVFSDLSRSPAIQICNTGLGVARNLTVDISVPLDDVLPAFNEAFLDDNLNLSRECGNLKFETTWGDGTVVSHTHSMSCVMREQYLFAGRANTIEAEIPAYLPEMLRLVAVRVFEKDDGKGKELLKMITLNVRAEFFDEGGKRYNSEYLYTFTDGRFDHETRKYHLRFK